MMNKLIKIKIVVIFFCLLSSIGFSQKNKVKKFERQINSLKSRNSILKTQLNGVKLERIQADIKKIGLPKIVDGEKIISHSAFSLVYSEEHEQAKWVAHVIIPDAITGNASLNRNFVQDPLIETYSAREEDYLFKVLKSETNKQEFQEYGFDRGHLAPAEDFKWSEKAHRESYYYSNISPQVADFNRDKWFGLEELLRQYLYVNRNTQLYVVTGPLLNDSLPKIEKGLNQVSVPNYFYKVALDFMNKKAIAFLMPNSKIDSSLSNYVLSINELEEKTGIDFFHLLEDELENQLESQNSIADWSYEQINKDTQKPLFHNVPEETYSVVDAKQLMGSNKRVKVEGNVMGGKVLNGGDIILYLEKPYPNHIFTVHIKKEDMVFFSYDPLIEWEGKQIILTGEVVRYRGIPTIHLDSEELVEYN